MKVNVTKKEEIEIDIDEIKAFKILCKTLHMEWMLCDDFQYYVLEDEYGDRSVWKTVEYGYGDRKVDDRGDLFIALCGVAENIIPNCELRNPRIVKREEI